MARQARKTQKTTVFSIKQNTINPIFRNREDREKFVSIIESNKKVYGFDIYAYCLLDDHDFWIILNAKNRSISSIMQSITISYALYRDDVNNLFIERYHSKPIYSKEELEKEINELKSDKRYETCNYCFYDQKQNLPLDFISILEDNLEIEQKHYKPLNDQNFIKLIDQYISDDEEICKNVSNRNDFIRKIYASYNVTQRQLAEYFDISTSSISKILRQGA